MLSILTWTLIPWPLVKAGAVILGLWLVAIFLRWFFGAIGKV